MSKAIFDALKPVSGGFGWVMTPSKFMPQIALAPDDGSGSKSEDEKAEDQGDGQSKDDSAGEKQSKEESKDDGKEAKSDKSKPTQREAELLKEVMDKKDKLKSTQKELDVIKQQLKDFEGIDPVKIRDMLKAQADAEKAAAEAKGDFERVKAMMADEHAKEIEKVRTEKDQTLSQLQEALNRINELTIGDAFTRSAFIKDELILTPAKARTVYGAHFEIQDNRIVAYDKPKGSASRTLLVDGAGDPLGFEEAVKKLVDTDPDRDAMLRSKLKEGAGSKPATEKMPKKAETGMSGVSRIAAALSASKSK